LIVDPAAKPETR